MTYQEAYRQFLLTRTNATPDECIAFVAGWKAALATMEETE